MICLSLLYHTNSSNLYTVYIINRKLYSVKIEGAIFYVMIPKMFF